MKRIIKLFLDNMPYIGNLRKQLEKQGDFPAGHYYSPIPDRNEVLTYINSRKPLEMQLPDIDINKDGQLRLLNEYSEFYKELPFPDEQKSDFRYFFNNNYFSHSDAILLQTPYTNQKRIDKKLKLTYILGF